MSAEQLVADFLATTVESSEMNTEYKLCPELEEAPLTVKGTELRAGTYQDSASGEERAWYSLSVEYSVDSPEAREEMGRDEVVVYGSVFLTVKDGELDMENNQQLAKLLKIFDINPTELTIQEIFDSLIGNYCVGKITHVAQMKKKEPVLDDEGNPKYNAEVTMVSAA